MAEPTAPAARRLSRLRRALWIAAGLARALAGAVALGWWQVEGPGAARPFAMTDHRGQPFNHEDLRGRPTLLFFGFTHCPDVCPTTLNDVTRWLEALGAAAADLKAVFVTVDPARDDVAQLAGYLTAFDPRIVGLTGSPEALAALAKAYGVVYERVESGGDYTMDHTASLLLLDRQGALVGTLDPHEAEATALPKIRLLLSR